MNPYIIDFNFTRVGKFLWKKANNLKKERKELHEVVLEYKRELLKYKMLG